MQSGIYDVHAPLLLGGERSEAEVFGAAVWLWMHSPQHRDLPLHALPTVLLPIIKHQHYLLVSREGRPVCFISWMSLDNDGGAPLPVAARDYGAGERLAERRPPVDPRLDRAVWRHPRHQPPGDGSAVSRPLLPLPVSPGKTARDAGDEF